MYTKGVPNLEVKPSARANCAASHRCQQRQCTGKNQAPSGSLCNSSHNNIKRFASAIGKAIGRSNCAASHRCHSGNIQVFISGTPASHTSCNKCCPAGLNLSPKQPLTSSQQASEPHTLTACQCATMTGQAWCTRSIEGGDVVCALAWCSFPLLPTRCTDHHSALHQQHVYAYFVTVPQGAFHDPQD